MAMFSSLKKAGLKAGRTPIIGTEVAAFVPWQQILLFIEAIEAATGIEAKKNFMPLQPGDVPATHADVSELESYTGFKPAMPVPQGIRNFVAWYRDYFRV